MCGNSIDRDLGHAESRDGSYDSRGALTRTEDPTTGRKRRRSRLHRLHWCWALGLVCSLVVACGTLHASSFLASQASASGTTLKSLVPAGNTQYGNAAVGPESPPMCDLATSVAPLAPTTIGTIQQAYDCIFAYYYAGPVLDDATLLVGAFAGFTQELERLGMDDGGATLPALTGDRQADWRAFARVYGTVERELPARATLRQELAAATMTGMVESLGDNHAWWDYPLLAPDGAPYGLGLQTSPALTLAAVAPAEALGPMFVTTVDGGPALQAGLRPGDVIVSVDGVPPFVDGLVSAGVVDLLSQAYPQSQALRITFHRPATGRTWTVRMQPQAFEADYVATNVVSSKLAGDVAYVAMSNFEPGVADEVLTAILGPRGQEQAARGHSGPEGQRRRLTGRGSEIARRFHARQSLEL